MSRHYCEPEFTIIAWGPIPLAPVTHNYKVWSIVGDLPYSPESPFGTPPFGTVVSLHCTVRIYKLHTVSIANSLTQCAHTDMHTHNDKYIALPVECQCGAHYSHAYVRVNNT